MTARTVVGHLVGSQRRRLLLAAVVAGLTAAAGPTLLAVSAWLIVRASEQPPVLYLLTAIVAVRALALLRAVGSYVERLAGHAAAFGGLADLRSRLFEALIPLVPGRLTDTAEGDVLAALTQDTEDLQHGIVAGLVPTAGVGGAILAMVGLAGWLDPAAGLVVAAAVVVAGVLTTAAVLRARRRRHAGQDVRAALHAATVDGVSAAEDLRINGAVDRTMAELDRLGRAAAQLDTRSATGRGTAAALALLVAGLAAVAVVSAVDLAAIDVRLVAPLLLLTLGTVELAALLAVGIQHSVESWAAASRIATTLATPPPPVRSTALPTEVEAVGLANVAVDHAGLSGLDLVVERGSVTALVGPSGAGKTTAIRVLAGLVAPDGGTVVADGRPVPHVGPLVAVAGQDAHLFPTSIEANIRLGNPDASEGQVRAVVEQCQLAEWADGLPEGLATHVGVGEVTVSGGQRRRITLARALLSGRPFLVLDEPTADLDPSTAEAFLRDALAAAADRGVLVATHDSRIPPLADRVVALRGGRGRPGMTCSGDHRDRVGARRS